MNNLQINLSNLQQIVSNPENVEDAGVFVPNPNPIYAYQFTKDFEVITPSGPKQGKAGNYLVITQDMDIRILESMHIATQFKKLQSL